MEGDVRVAAFDTTSPSSPGVILSEAKEVDPNEHGGGVTSGQAALSPTFTVFANYF
jgi:hypothetical protein